MQSQLWLLFHENRKLGCTARLRESELDSIESDDILVTDPHETLGFLLNKFKFLTTLMCSVIVRVKCDQMDLERKRCSNVIANRFGLINGAKTICSSFRSQKMTLTTTDHVVDERV